MNIAPFFVIVRDAGSSMSERLAAFIVNQLAAPGLELLYDTDGVTAIGASGASAITLPDGAGLIWGTLFERNGSARVRRLSRIDPASAGRFADRYWGGYVSVVKSGATVEICRDPSGAIPCYHARIDNADLFTTRPAMLFDAGFVRPEIDWTIITQCLVYRDLRPARTALRGIAELMPGSCATLEAGTIRIATAWSPWRFAGSESEIRSMDEAVDRVRRATTESIGAWGKCFERPIIELSGGLDSSIVAAVLAQGSTRPVCVTFAATEGDPDETPYARAVAEHLGLPLEILSADIAAVDVTTTRARELPRPSARAFAQAHDTRLRAIAASDDADAFFSGGGGDNVFAYLQSVLPVIDHWKRGGGGVMGTIGDVASIAEVSLWQTLVASVRRAVRHRSARRWMTDQRFMSDAALSGLPFPHGHPWTDVPAPILPGKRVHGQAMVVIQNHLEGFGRLQDAPIISPLTSQPVVETCMAIPTWLWCKGGINRAVARAAFADRLPHLVSGRRTKGAFDAYCARVFDANRGAIREMVLNGALATQGLIEPRQIAATLSPASLSRTDMLRLLDLVDVEAWIEAWTSRPSGI